MLLDVPYYSQYFDVDDEYWKPRACGFCCFKMVTEYHGKESKGIVELANDAKANGGYTENGIVHDYVLKIARDLGLQAHREEKMENEKGINDIVNHLENFGPVTVSIVKERDGKKLFHQVVIVGFEKDGGLVKGFYMHDSDSPENGGGKNKFVTLDEFLKEWRRMAIFISK